MTRLQHIFFLGVVVCCIAGGLLTRRHSTALPEEAEPTSQPATSPQAPPRQADDGAATQARIVELKNMEVEVNRRERAAAQTYEVRQELRAARHDAWHSVISTNWPAYEELRKKAVDSPSHEAPCTLCDGKGYMPFCVLCRQNSGKCVTCAGTGIARGGEQCPACFGTGKCYLCYGGGRMACAFCSDGTIMTKLPPPPNEMPINCEEVVQSSSKITDRPPPKQSPVLNAASDLIQEGPSIEQAIVEERSRDAANPPPSVWREKGEYILLSVVFVFVAVLLVCVLSRHKREAEIRALAGTYLRDGVEAARMKMPPLFAPPVSPTWPQGTRDNKRFDSAPEKDPVQEFFAHAPESLAAMQKTVQEIVSGNSDLNEALAELRKQIAALKISADFWEARPAWQVASALQLLIARLNEKPQEATPSVLCTVTSAIDLLHTLCKPGVRPDLIIDPPVEVLAVDDDPLCLRALVYALQKATLTPDVAENGKKALTLATQKVYDVIFLDINMPEMDGLTACARIRETDTNAETPVVFVTVRSDFKSRADSMARGGTELIGKPFLIFELTVKAMIFAVRKRLRLQQCVAPPTPDDTVSPGTEITKADSSSRVAVPLASMTNVQSVAPAAMESVAEPPIDLDGDLFAKAPEFFARTRQMLEEAGASADLNRRQEILGKIYLRIHALGNKTRLANLTLTNRTTTALEALLKRLHQNPKTISASTLNTIANALNVLDGLCAPGAEQKLAHDTPIKILVVEDEAFARRAVVGTLQLVFGKPDSANDGVQALSLASQNTYDIIFSDIEMPDMGGFGLCARIRQGGPNQSTPVIFITSHIDFESRARAVESGGTDFIAKPFLPIEITVKALTFALEGRLRKINAEPSLMSSGTLANPTESTPLQLLPAVNC